MTMATKNNIFKEYLSEYLKANKKNKGEILKHVCFVTKIHNKSAIRKFRVLQLSDSCKKEKRGRAMFYTPDVIAALHEIWEMAGKICGELLHPVIKEYVEILIRDKMWKYDNEVTDKLLFMSSSTVRRKVTGFSEASGKRKGFKTTKPSLFKTIVPVFKGLWDKFPAGYGQIDTVVHCGNTLFGDYAYTCNNTDGKTLWTVPRAQWNKGEENTRVSMEYIKQKMPFPWLGSHSDSGTEFLNGMVVSWCFNNGIEPSRSRAGHKNDNMFIEERNGHVVRKFVGYQRLDCMEAVDALNELYDVLAVYLNHFIPVRRCVEKIKIGSRYKRKYEKKAKAPYWRVLEEETISEEVKIKLKTEHGKLNPFVLHKKIERAQKKIYDTQQRYGKS